jgi:hypothetical protein
MDAHDFAIHHVWHMQKKLEVHNSKTYSHDIKKYADTLSLRNNATLFFSNHSGLNIAHSKFQITQKFRNLKLTSACHIFYFGNSLTHLHFLQVSAASDT